MVSWLSNWAEAIIIAVIIATIIEMILPEGSSKKYIKVVIGVYILFTIVSPVITQFTGKSLAVSDFLDLDSYINEVKEKETTQNLLQENNAASIKDIYVGNLKADIQNKLKGKGYTVTTIFLEVGDDENYTLHKISLSIIKDEDKEEDNTEESFNTIVNSIEVVNEISISVSNIQHTQESTNIVEKEKMKTNLTSSEKEKIKEYLSSVYEINEKNIVID